MRRLRILVMAALLAAPAGLLTARISAQDEPRGEPEEKAYVTPPAWRSVEVGNFYLRRKRYRAALSRFKEAAQTDPYNAEAHLGMGRVYDRLGLRQKALENYRKYLDLLPSAKQAEEARDVHKAIARLEEKLKGSRPPPSARAKSDQAATSPR
jgi:tetratricopeptide (TPR) repeat protein